MGLGPCSLSLALSVLCGGPTTDSCLSCVGGVVVDDGLTHMNSHTHTHINAPPHIPQGRQSMISRFQNSSLMEKEDEYRPLLFHASGADRGKPEPFPVGPKYSGGGAVGMGGMGGMGMGGMGGMGGGGGGGRARSGSSTPGTPSFGGLPYF